VGNGLNVNGKLRRQPLPARVHSSDRSRTCHSSHASLSSCTRTGGASRSRRQSHRHHASSPACGGSRSAQDGGAEATRWMLRQARHGPGQCRCSKAIGLFYLERRRVAGWIGCQVLWLCSHDSSAGLRRHETKNNVVKVVSTTGSRSAFEDLLLPEGQSRLVNFQQVNVRHRIRHGSTPEIRRRSAESVSFAL
jgi:hypothetical protein